MLSARLLRIYTKTFMQLSVLLTERKNRIYLGVKSKLYSHCGGYGGEDPPVLIPNTEVKLSCAESTLWATAREDRSPPHFIKDNPNGLSFFFCFEWTVAILCGGTLFFGKQKGRRYACLLIF